MFSCLPSSVRFSRLNSTIESMSGCVQLVIWVYLFSHILVTLVIRGAPCYTISTLTPQEFRIANCPILSGSCRTMHTIRSSLGFILNRSEKSCTIPTVTSCRQEPADNKMIDPKSLCCGSWFLVLCSIWVIITVMSLKE